MNFLMPVSVFYEHRYQHDLHVPDVKLIGCQKYSYSMEQTYKLLLHLILNLYTKIEGSIVRFSVSSVPLCSRSYCKELTHNVHIMK
jgi:hypothetical protein